MHSGFARNSNSTSSMTSISSYCKQGGKSTPSINLCCVKQWRLHSNKSSSIFAFLAMARSFSVLTSIQTVIQMSVQASCGRPLFEEIVIKIIFSYVAKETVYFPRPYKTIWLPTFQILALKPVHRLWTC